MIYFDYFLSGNFENNGFAYVDTLDCLVLQTVHISVDSGNPYYDPSKGKIGDIIFKFLFSFKWIISLILPALFQVNWFTNEDGFSDYAVFTNTPWTVLLFFLTLYLACTIFFCFMLSGFFSKGMITGLHRLFKKKYLSYIPKLLTIIVFIVFFLHSQFHYMLYSIKKCITNKTTCHERNSNSTLHCW